MPREGAAVAAVKQAVRRGGWGWLWLPMLGMLLAAAAAQAAEKMPQRVLRATAADAAPGLDDDGNARVIVKYRSGSRLATELATTRRGADRLGGRLQLALQDGHVLGPRSQSLRARGISPQALAARLAADADVEWAQPVRRKTINAIEPNDLLFRGNQTTTTPVAGQWYLRAPDATLVSAVNAVGAWAITTGSASVTVAVLDTGVRRDHPDLQGKLRPGYDFVRNNTTANDSQPGRDDDPSDPGDWRTSTDSCYDARGDGYNNSSWHGTQVAGLIGAATDNGIGIAGTGRNTMVLPVRVLGRCGGFDDDIIAGMRWAAGLSNAAGCGSGSAVSATCNPHPARVLNLSLGSSGTCSSAYSQVIADLNAAGVIVAVASGNDTGHAVNEPANCAGALAVAGVRHAGTKVGYSNIGPQVAIAAPAGNCVNSGRFEPCLYPLVTTDNNGSTTPGSDVYSSGNSPSLGTSFATPIVAASAALLLAVDPTLTPALVKSTLQATARPFPTVGAQSNGARNCKAPSALDQVECYCTTATCGAGLLDIGAAVARAARSALPPLAVLQASIDQPTLGMTLDLDSGPSSASTTARSWVVVGGPAQLVGAADGRLARLLTTGAGRVTVRLAVTDAAGRSGSVDKTIDVKTGPTAAFTVDRPDPTLGGLVTLNALPSAAAPGRGLSYQWLLIGSTLAQFTSATNASSAVVLPSSTGNDLEVRLTVTDSQGESHVTSQTLGVSAAPTAKIDLAGAQVAVGSSLAVVGSGTAADGHTVAAYQWSVLQGGQNLSIDSGAGSPTVTVRGMAPGQAQLRLTVTDDAGAVATSEATVTVVAASSGGGGGAMGAGWLTGLAAAVLLLRGAPGRRRPQA